MRFAFILNPTAAHGSAGRKRAALKRAAEAARLEVTWFLTEHPGHAVELARRAAETHDAVVAVGGDGTVQHVARGLIEAGTAAALGVVPVGTGNDFVKMLPVPPEPLAAVRALAHACPAHVDYGVVRCEEEGHAKELLFINAVGAGFDAQAAVEVDGFKRLPGVAAYLAAVLRTLQRWHGPNVRVTADGDEIYAGPMLLVTVGNGVSSGGGFYLTPSASVSDGHLDVCLIEDATKARVLQLLPRVLRGRHVGAREVHLHLARHVRVESDTPIPVHADGEMLTLGTRRIDVQVVPEGLCVLGPAF